MVYISTFKTKIEWIIPLVVVWDIRGVYHALCFCLRHSRNIP
jgi:hypothetical protein